MKFRTFPALLLMLASGLSGCARWQDDADNPQQETMTVSVDFREVHRCSRISPEITVAYAPTGTRFYDVRLVELGDRERFLGGGSWQDDGTGLIPEGALTMHYTGPCPPANRRTDYTYVVSAMEDANSQPLAVRLYRFTLD